jgi:tetratricopeptide (TPR) repeat protein
MKLQIEEVETPTLCLNMIVKNESKIITRLFDSVLPVIDSYCICDTGSTDNTKEVIREYFEKHGIPGKIVEEPFVNFAHNRNFALQSCFGMSDYVLLLDADMIFEVSPKFDKAMLKSHDAFLILQGSDDFYYNNMRIVKNNLSYLYIGVTHEYISTPEGCRSLNIEKNVLFIRDIGDGGSKANKFERDIGLLKKGIEENPNSDRYHFYLANSYYDSGKNEEAIETYKKRIAIGGWDQEVWYSYYRIGMAYKNLDKMGEAIYYWLEAYNFLPNRIENLYEIIQHYRIEGKCKLAYSFYKMAVDALKTVTDKDSYLFLNNSIYTFKLDYELSIISSYLGIKNINDQVIIIFNNCNEQHITDITLSNMKFYKDILKPDFLMDKSLTMDHQIANKVRKFKSSSSCIIANDDGYYMNMRLVNYTIDSGGYYHDCDDHIITVNKFFELSKDFKVLNEKLLDSVFDGRRYVGVEDVRICKDAVKNSIIFMGTGLHENGNLGICSGLYDTNSDFLKAVDIKPSFSNLSCEKNWVYVNLDGESHIVYGWSPLHICKINGSSLDTVRTLDNMPKIFKLMRGSTNGVEFGDEIWFITHIVSYEQPRHYYHCFVVFDKSMKLLRYSAPFKFEGECIEYCVGMVVEKDRVIVPYSTWDRTTKLAVYNKEYIDSIVKYT